MAYYVSVPRDLTKVKEKVLFNLTKRQLVCFGLAAVVGVPAFFWMKSMGNTSLASIGMILIMIPGFLFGMYEKDGQPMEKIAMQYIQATFLRPKIRPYRTDNYYAILIRQEQVEKEVGEIVEDSKSVHKEEKQTAAGSR